MDVLSSFDAPSWLAAALGPGRPVLVAAVFVAVLADHRRLRRLVAPRVRSGPSNR